MDSWPPKPSRTKEPAQPRYELVYYRPNDYLHVLTDTRDADGKPLGGDIKFWGGPDGWQTVVSPNAGAVKFQCFERYGPSPFWGRFDYSGVSTDGTIYLRDGGKWITTNSPENVTAKRYFILYGDHGDPWEALIADNGKRDLTFSRRFGQSIWRAHPE